jgi:NAD(P)H-dependent FMN reductase
MPPPMDVAVIVGSLRKGSYSRKIARALIQLAPKGRKCFRRAPKMNSKLSMLGHRGKE